MTNLSELFWPSSQLGEAINELEMRSGLMARGGGLPHPSNAAQHARRQSLVAWIEMAAKRLGLEAEEVGTPYGEVEKMILAAGPALLRAPGEQNFLAVLGGGAGKAPVLAPDLTGPRGPMGAVR